MRQLLLRKTFRLIGLDQESVQSPLVILRLLQEMIEVQLREDGRAGVGEHLAVLAADLRGEVGEQRLRPFQGCGGQLIAGLEGKHLGLRLVVGVLGGEVGEQLLRGLVPAGGGGQPDVVPAFQGREFLDAFSRQFDLVLLLGEVAFDPLQLLLGRAEHVGPHQEVEDLEAPLDKLVNGQPLLVPQVLVPRQECIDHVRVQLAGPVIRSPGIEVLPFGCRIDAVGIHADVVRRQDRHVLRQRELVAAGLAILIAAVPVGVPVADVEHLADGGKRPGLGKAPRAFELVGVEPIDQAILIRIELGAIDERVAEEESPAQVIHHEDSLVDREAVLGYGVDEALGRLQHKPAQDATVLQMDEADREALPGREGRGQHQDEATEQRPAAARGGMTWLLSVRRTVPLPPVHCPRRRGPVKALFLRRS